MLRAVVDRSPSRISKDYHRQQKTNLRGLFRPLAGFQISPRPFIASLLLSRILLTERRRILKTLSLCVPDGTFDGSPLFEREPLIERRPCLRGGRSVNTGWSGSPPGDGTVVITRPKVGIKNKKRDVINFGPLQFENLTSSRLTFAGAGNFVGPCPDKPQRPVKKVTR